MCLPLGQATLSKSLLFQTEDKETINKKVIVMCAHFPIICNLKALDYFRIHCIHNIVLTACGVAWITVFLAVVVGFCGYPITGARLP